MRPRALFFVSIVFASAAALGAAASCSTFEGEPAVDGDAATEGSTTPPDGPAFDASTRRGSCPPPKGTRKALTDISVRQLYAPPSSTFPYGLAADATHVTWIDQSSDSDAGGAAFGLGAGRVLRIAKSGGAPIVLARDQPAAITVVVDESFAYWTTWDGTAANLMRTPLTAACTADMCPTPDKIATFDARTSKIFLHAPGVLIAQVDDGRVFHVQGNTATRMLTTGGTPGLVLTDTHVYASTENGSPNVQRATVSATPIVESAYLAIPPATGTNIGVGHLATDCSSLFMTRYSHNLTSSTYVHDFAKPGSYELVIPAQTIIHDLVVDARNGWVALGPAGVYVGERGTKSVVPVFPRSVFRLAIDDEGVYFGEHGGAQSGTIHMALKD